MEPWLDSLSEDWNSEPHLSSPTPSISQDSRYASIKSQSRIPHLAQSLRRDSTGSYLKPRSTRGIARANELVLVERSASSLNLPASPRESLRKSKPSSLPRRPSSTFSESQSSVQHHSVNKDLASQETPEWKKRLMKGEESANDGVDLFSPSKLEGMFADPISTHESDPKAKWPEGKSKPWGTLKLGQFTSTAEQYQSLRASRNRQPQMEALQEVDEDERDKTENDILEDYNLAQHDEDRLERVGDMGKTRSARHTIQQDTDHFKRSTTISTANSRVVSRNSKDPRWRTFSGQQEMKNELISPITLSATNTIRDSAVKIFDELNAGQLRQRLENQQAKRPSSSSSDHDVSYMDQSRKDDSVQPTLLPEMTSHSLPDDLSMGTQDILSSNKIRNTNANDVPVEPLQAVDQSKSVGHSRFMEPSSSSQIFRSSPPVKTNSILHHVESTDTSDLLPELLSDTSVVRHSPSPTRPSSSRSPLKLFGNRDTYTSNKLMRVLSQYGQDASTRENSSVYENDLVEENKADEELRMSHFGEGELDDFNFEKEIARPFVVDTPRVKITDKIFRDIGSSVVVDQHKQRARETDENESDEHQKRLPSSPAKDRTPKRRRTLLKDEIFVEGVTVEVKLDQVPDKSSAIAGKKRKDARPGENGEQADANVLAARTILRPKAGSRKSSASAQTDLKVAEPNSGPSTKLTAVLAAELESFAKGVSEAHQDSRKPSLATKDYMEEANKVMEFIRARGKPTAKLSDVHEPIDFTDLNSDDILDLEIEDDSTKESFSRPPSRERPHRPREDRRIAKHDTKTANQLKKYQETDDLELLASTSAIGTLNMVDNQAASEAACIPIPEESQESSPPNIRLSGPVGKLEDDLNNPILSEEKQKQQSLASSSTHTATTGSSGSSGRKGIISHGTVTIPDKVGTMKFDRDRQIWVKQKMSERFASEFEKNCTPVSVKEVTLDEDPFKDIPDLSIDEQQEIVSRQRRQDNKAIDRVNTLLTDPRNHLEENVHMQNSDQESLTSRASPQSEFVYESELRDEDGYDEYRLSAPSSPAKSEASKHEERLHEGLSSVEPAMLQGSKKQARAVTITFSSPVASHITYTQPLDVHEDGSDDDDDDASFLPPEDSDNEDYGPISFTGKTLQDQMTTKPSRRISQMKFNPGPRRSSALIQAPMPVIKEDDSGGHENEGMSLVYVGDSLQMTPRPMEDRALSQQASAYKGSSILCLTPLSEFTMHQADAGNPDDGSFVAARPHPKALLQAHGALALSKDELVKAITDMVPSEPFWEKLRRLNLTEKRLTSLSALQEYCPILEALSVARNSIVQLNGLPYTIRQLDISMNCLNDFTSWGHLQNLQHIDVSSNKLESLDGFNTLYHLRELNASNNQIHDIEGVLDLDSLMTIDLSGNHLTNIDFEGASLTHLRKINLSDNKLASIRNIHHLPQLEQLVLDRNSLRDFDILAQLPSLRSLSLAHNELESLDLANLMSVQDLSIDGNSVRSIQGLSLASTLRTLSARDQRHSFDFVNTILATPNECSALLLSSNALAEGLITLPPLPHYNLRHLELAACGLRALPQTFGDFFPNCRKLNLNFNAVSDLSPLLGSVKLSELMLAGNRIQRMRRSCVVFSRLHALSRLDIRDNPLTVGFYAPPILSERPQDAFTVPVREMASDEKWLQVLDETTSLRRRVFELMLADGCKSLRNLDGLSFVGQDLLNMSTVWSSLTSKGVIMKPTDSEMVETVHEVNANTALAAGTSAGRPHEASSEQPLTNERGLGIE